MEIAYIAGLFDGEGSVSLMRKGATFIARVSITNTHDGVLRLIQEQFGGTIYKRQYRGHGQDVWGWQRNNSSAIAFLRHIRPHLIIKAPQADLLIESEKFRLGSGAWSGPEADHKRAGLLQARQKIMAINSSAGNKRYNAKDYAIHPATTSTKSGWARGRKGMEQ